MTSMRRRILFISTPVAPIGSGGGGGVETTLRQITSALASSGHDVAVIAPAGSRLDADIRIYPISGSPPPSVTVANRESRTMVGHGVLERMWDQARAIQDQYDAIIAMTYDWLSYYLTPFFPIPVLHWVTVPSLVDVVDQAISIGYAERPDRFVFYSRAQAATFSFVDAGSVRIIPGAVDIKQFQFHADPGTVLAWAARISPEKGLEDAVKVAAETGMPLHVCGTIQDQDYWEAVRRLDGGDKIVYHGMLSHDRLQHVLGRAAAMLVTPKWVEAFGMTVVEALACGTPVVAYAGGGPSEILEDGKSGRLVPQGDVAAMVRAVKNISTIRRRDARERAENYSADRMAGRVEAWVESALA
jgi:UDP-glucose:tetrahydrobiopterin glucosyltransferase